MDSAQFLRAKTRVVKTSYVKNGQIKARRVPGMYQIDSITYLLKIHIICCYFVVVLNI